ncbi:hypothetical protein F9B85_13775 [Heliorestis acidaminivorans]|uniref:Uncharacterized protein n=1 Tax=Heliorestis acidaminivorans TaxID=553427 RepID=A0A6I0ETY2_9FIRM|nr:hypothetical protein [Heliorestis acidaminivorans]KAB2950892.1 hypothetical protein F9B85_13775 [Heliorestis acidaminivorans]
MAMETVTFILLMLTTMVRREVEKVKNEVMVVFIMLEIKAILLVKTFSLKLDYNKNLKNYGELIAYKEYYQELLKDSPSNDYLKSKLASVQLEIQLVSGLITKQKLEIARLKKFKLEVIGGMIE